MFDVGRYGHRSRYAMGHGLRGTPVGDCRLEGSTVWYRIRHGRSRTVANGMICIAIWGVVLVLEVLLLDGSAVA